MINKSPHIYLLAFAFVILKVIRKRMLSLCLYFCDTDWEATHLGNCLKRGIFKSGWEGARGLLDPGSKGLSRVCCTTKNHFFALVQPQFAPRKESFCSPGPKTWFHPLLTTSGNFLFFFRHFLWSVASQHNNHQRSVCFRLFYCPLTGSWRFWGRRGGGYNQNFGTNSILSGHLGFLKRFRKQCSSGV